MLVTVRLARVFVLELELREPYFDADQPTSLECEVLRLGRQRTAAAAPVQIALDEETISQPHGEFFVREGMLVYRDLHSEYGTIFLDGYRQLFGTRILGGYRELATLAEQSRATEYVFAEEDFKQSLTFQLGQVGVSLVVRRVGADRP